MSRSGVDWRDEAAAGLQARHVPALALDGPVLVMRDPRPDVADALAGQGLEVRRWWRRALAGRPATPWPEGDGYGAVALRLPRAREELEMTLHAALSILRPGGRVLVYGAGDEGIRSTPRRMEPWTGEVATVAIGGRCRVLEAVRPPTVPGLKGRLGEWRETFDPGDPALGKAWASYPGVFAHGRLDDGSRLLLGALPGVPDGGTVLDFGCGSGVLGAAVLAGSPGSSVEFLDVDAVALEAVEENVPGGARTLGDGLAAARCRRYDLIVSNPPYHRGKERSMGVLEELIAGAPARLGRRGELLLVAQRRIPVGRWLEERFRRVRVVADDGRVFRVWRAGEPSGREPGGR